MTFNEISIGSKYRHFKGNLYKVIAIAKHSETMEDMVVYQALYGDKPIYVRPANMWNEMVERDGYQMKRFTKIVEPEYIMCAAIKYYIKGEDTAKYVIGGNHGQCIESFANMELYKTDRDMDREEQGFLTTSGRFVDRYEAWNIAKMAGQLRYYDSADTTPKKLISENVNYRNPEE